MFDMWNYYLENDLSFKSTPGVCISYMYNSSSLPIDSNDEIYWGGLERLKMFYGGEWVNLNITSVSLRYLPNHHQFVLYRTRLGNFAFVTDESNGSFVAFLPNKKSSQYDYFWLCLAHCVTVSRKNVRGIHQCNMLCRCGADDHCVDRPIYSCVICGSNVIGGGQLCDKTDCLMKHLF